MIVTIDGLSGSGKSTLAKALATRLGVAHVDTGAYYRAVTLAVLRAGADPHDPRAVLDAARRSHIERVEGRTLLDGDDVEGEIRGRDVTASVSPVSAHPAVREHLVTLQRAAVPEVGAVVEGRDAGTVVVPDADLKVWLTARPEVRAARRASDVGDRTEEGVAEQLGALAARDARDAAQSVPAADAVTLDSSDADVDALVEHLIVLLGQRPGGRP